VVTGGGAPTGGTTVMFGDIRATPVGLAGMNGMYTMRGKRNSMRT
jgi:hypothetical protein